MQLSAATPKDRRSSAARFSIRSASALPMKTASSAPSAANTIGLLRSLRNVRFGIVVIVVAPSKRRSDEREPPHRRRRSNSSAPRLAAHNGAKPLDVRKVRTDERWEGATVRTGTIILWCGSLATSAGLVRGRSGACRSTIRVAKNGMVTRPHGRRARLSRKMMQDSSAQTGRSDRPRGWTRMRRDQGRYALERDSGMTG